MNNLINKLTVFDWKNCFVRFIDDTPMLSDCLNVLGIVSNEDTDALFGTQKTLVSGSKVESIKVISDEVSILKIANQLGTALNHESLLSFYGAIIDWRKTLKSEIRKSLCPQIKTSTRGFVYLVRNAENAYKIGKTKNPLNRLSNLKAGSLPDLDFIYVFLVNDQDKVESLLLSYFENYRIKREWFSFRDEHIIEFPFVIENSEFINEQMRYDLRYPSKEEYELVIEFETNQRNKWLLIFCYFGLSPSQISNMKWTDFIEVNEHLVSLAVDVFPGIALEKENFDCLKKDCSSSSKYVFASRKAINERRLDRSRIFQIVQKAGERIGLQRLSPSSFKKELTASLGFAREFVSLDNLTATDGINLLAIRKRLKT